MDPANFFPSDFEDDAGSDSIEFVYEDVDFKLNEPERLRQWIEKVVEQERKTLNHLCFIFCTDGYLHQINVEFLDHDTLTDIISFPYGDGSDIEGDIFISLDRVRDNARQLEVPFQKELHRVIIHGVLHFCGYGDKTEADQKRMRSKEDEKLSLLEGG